MAHVSAIKRINNPNFFDVVPIFKIKLTSFTDLSSEVHPSGSVTVHNFFINLFFSFSCSFREKLLK